MKKRIVVAIDGPAGSGKSSVSKEVATLLGMKYIDSGALYRSVTWHMIGKYGDLTRDIDFSASLQGLQLSQEFYPDGTSRTFAGGKDISHLIRNEEIAKNIGVVSDDIDVRHFVNSMLREWGEKESIIMDGRDIGTVVFPGADLKIYLDASAEIRAERRIKEYREMGKNLDENSVKKQIIQRDEEDRSRPYGKLVQAEDAVYIDTSTMTKEEVIGTIEALVKTHHKTL